MLSEGFHFIIISEIFSGRIMKVIPEFFAWRFEVFSLKDIHFSPLSYGLELLEVLSY